MRLPSDISIIGKKPSDAVFRAAKKAAMRSSSYDYRIGAVIFAHGKPLVYSFNVFQTKPQSVSCHAEIRTINLGKNKLKNIRGYSIFVLRLNRSGALKTSKPCRECYKALISAGLSVSWIQAEEIPLFTPLALKIRSAYIY